MFTRQAPVEHSRLGGTDDFEAVHYVAWHENDGSVSGSAGLIIGDELISALYNEEDFVLIKMTRSRGPSPGLWPAMLTERARR